MLHKKKNNRRTLNSSSLSSGLYISVTVNLKFYETNELGGATSQYIPDTRSK